MESWRSVRLTRARQVVELMNVRGSQLPAPEVTVRDHYEILRGSDPSEAVAFIGHALPRHEAIHWAAGLIAVETPDAATPEHEAIAHVRRWLDDPAETHRQKAYAIAQQADLESPERTLATALFYSGGSIAPPDAPPVQPAPGLGNQLAVVAVIQAAYRSSDVEAFLTKALERAEAIAETGISVRP